MRSNRFRIVQVRVEEWRCLRRGLVRGYHARQGLLCVREWRYVRPNRITGIPSFLPQRSHETLTRINGCSYEGEYRRGKKHGHGVFTDAQVGLSLFGTAAIGPRRMAATSLTQLQSTVPRLVTGLGLPRRLARWDDARSRQDDSLRRQVRLSLVSAVPIRDWHHRSTHTFAHRFYEGSWYEGQRSGLGRCLLADGSEYEGGWMENKRHGHGRSAMQCNASTACVRVGSRQTP
jgi:hypothetical protein